MHPTAPRPKKQAIPRVFSQFLRELGKLNDPSDSHVDTIILRTQADILDLIIRAKRRELGIKI